MLFKSLVALSGVALSLCLSNTAVFAAPLPLTIIHTNDIHSHFRPDSTPAGSRGGLARIKSAVDQIRRHTSNSLFLDGGDWSEGNIYYNLGAGVESLRLMDAMGYDAMVVGNHDWLNGPDHLLDTLEWVKPQAAMLAANAELTRYSRRNDFQRLIPPYVIKEVNGVRIAIIGLITFEFIYNDYLRPVKIQDPLNLTRDLATRLKSQVDAVIVISHNSIAMNRSLLARAPDVDLVIGAHDHVKLTRPIVIPRNGRAPGWVVEAGAHGHYLGRVDLKITPRSESPTGIGSVSLDKYRLVQMDDQIPEDPEILARIQDLETKLTRRYGPIFDDHVGDSEVELSTNGVENLMGDFVTDAYREATGAEIAFDHARMVYGTIHEGPIRTVDVYNANPGVYSPKTEKSWTVKTLPMKGKTLTWILNAFFSSKKLAQMAPLSTSGLQLTFEPGFTGRETPELPEIANSKRHHWFHLPHLKWNPFRRRHHEIPSEEADEAAEPDLLELPFEMPGDNLLNADNFEVALRTPIVGRVIVNGEPIDPLRTYTVAIAGGLLDALRYMNSLVPNIVPLDGLRETGTEDWRVLLDHIQKNSPLTAERFHLGSRIRTQKPDLGIDTNDIHWANVQRKGTRMVGEVHVKIVNYGATSSQPGARIHILLNQHGLNEAIDPSYIEGARVQSLSGLSPGQAVEIAWENVSIPIARGGICPVTVRIDGNVDEVNRTNDETTHYFNALRAPQ